MNQQNNSSKIDNFLKFLRLYLTNIKIYPLTSPLVESQVNQLYSLIKKLLEEYEYISISEIDGKIFINSEEYISKDPTSISNTLFLSKFFTQSGIKNITFKKDVNLEEIKDVLVALSSKKQKLTTKEIVQQLLKEKNIQSIVIDEVEFISVLKSDQNIKSIIRMISTKASSLPELMDILAKVVNELDKIQNENTKTQLLNTISKYVSSLDMQIVKELFIQQLPPKIEQLGIKKNIFNNLTKQSVEEIFNEIIKWCKQINLESKDETEYLDRLQNLKEFIKLVVNSPVSKLVPVEIIEELFKIGLIDVLPDWAKEKKEEKPWILELDEILNKNDPVILLQEKFLSSLKENIEKLCIIGLDDKIEKFSVLMTENLYNPVVKLRQLALNALDDIISEIIKYNKVGIIKNIAFKVLQYFFREQSQEVIEQYKQIFSQITESLVLSKQYNTFVSFSKQILKFAEEIKDVNQQKYSIINSVLEKTFATSKDYIFDDIIKKETQYFDDIIWFLNYISEKSINLMIDVIINSNDLDTRSFLSHILLKQKKQDLIINTIIRYLKPEISYISLSRILELIRKVNYDFSSYLIEIYKYVNYANKIGIINYIYQRFPTEENINWLISLLEYEDTQIIQYIVDVIIVLEYKPATKKLIKLLNTKNYELKKRVCIALGVLKEIDAIKHLKKILFSKPKLFGLIKAENLEVRLASCWALKNFISLPEIKRMFEKLAKSKEKTISDTAKEILQQK